MHSWYLAVSLLEWIGAFKVISAFCFPEVNASHTAVTTDKPIHFFSFPLEWRQQERINYGYSSLKLTIPEHFQQYRLSSAICLLWPLENVTLWACYKAKQDFRTFLKYWMQAGFLWWFTPRQVCIEHIKSFSLSQPCHIHYSFSCLCPLTGSFQTAQISHGYGFYEKEDLKKLTFSCDSIPYIHRTYSKHYLKSFLKSHQWTKSATCA